MMQSKNSSRSSCSSVASSSASEASNKTQLQPERGEALRELHPPTPVLTQLKRTAGECGAWPLLYPKLTEDEILQCKEIFARLAVAADDSEELFLDIVDIQSHLEALNMPVSEEAVDQLWSTLDLDGCQRLTFGAFLRIVQHHKTTLADDDGGDLLDSYVAMGGDSNMGGCIQADKLRSACKQFELAIDIEKLIREVDTDGSGQIEFDEWAVMFGAAEPDPDSDSEASGSTQKSSVASSSTCSTARAPSRLANNPSNNLSLSDLGVAIDAMDQRRTTRVRIPPKVTITPGARDILMEIDSVSNYSAVACNPIKRVNRPRQYVVQTEQLSSSRSSASSRNLDGFG